MQAHQARRVASTHADATRVVHGWPGIEADLCLQLLIRPSLLTLEPVDRPSDEYGDGTGV